eukprot:COSAG06_NODE_1715_length_8623_cov_12.480760_2_plen_101_part_00
MPSSAAVQVASGGDDTSSEAGGGARWVAHRWGVSVAGLSMDVVGVADETLRITALRPAARRGGIAEWTVVAKEIRFSSGCTSVPVAGQTAPACVQHVVLH